MSPLDRRRFLSALLASAAAARLPAGDSEPRVVWIVAGGGVRVADEWGRKPQESPWASLAERGTLYLAMRTAGPDRETAMASLLSGRDATNADGETAPFVGTNARPPLAASDVWWISNGKTPRLGAGVTPPRSLRPDIARDEDLRWLLDDLDPHLPLGTTLAPGLASSARPSETRTLARLVADLAAGFSSPARPGHTDAQVLRATRRIVTELRPRLTIAHLSEAEVADRSVASYRKVLEQHRQGYEALAQTIAEDDELAEVTHLVISHERGRDDEAQGGRLGDSSRSRSTERVSAFFMGPRIPRNRQPRRSVHTIDVAPTIAQILGVEGPKFDGRPIDGLFG